MRPEQTTINFKKNRELARELPNLQAAKNMVLSEA
jgi:hypothetical protein